jgi:hypothetical protein
LNRPNREFLFPLSAFTWRAPDRRHIRRAAAPVAQHAWTKVEFEYRTKREYSIVQDPSGFWDGRAFVKVETANIRFRVKVENELDKEVIYLYFN